MDECVDISDANADSDRAICETFRNFDLIEVARFLIVDR
jgi:hypothetical protein